MHITAWSHILYQLMLPDAFQGESHEEHIIVIQSEDDQDMSDYEQNLMVQEGMQLACNTKLCKGPPNQNCHLLLL